MAKTRSPSNEPQNDSGTRSNSTTSSDPRIRPERSYFCSERSCTWPSPFSTRQAWARHRESTHLNIRVDCPIPGCERVGDKGIKRKDNLPGHLLNRHGLRLLKQTMAGPSVSASSPETISVWKSIAPARSG